MTQLKIDEEGVTPDLVYLTKPPVFEEDDMDGKQIKLILINIVDSDSELSENKCLYLCDKIIDFDYGYAPDIFYCITDFKILLADICKNQLILKLNIDPTSTSSIPVFQKCQSLLHSTSSYLPSLLRTRLTVVDDSQLSIYDMQNLQKPVFGPTLHMMDEAMPVHLLTAENKLGKHLELEQVEEELRELWEGEGEGIEQVTGDKEMVVLWTKGWGSGIVGVEYDRIGTDVGFCVLWI